jgi:hypothetical protein
MGPVAEIEQLQRALHRRLPDASISVDTPDKPDGAWWVDVEQDGRIASVEWSLTRGYGVAGPGGGYGERPDFIVTDAEAAAELVASALAEAVDTQVRR